TETKSLFPSLTTLRLGRSTQLTVDSVRYISEWVESLPELEEFSLVMEPTPSSFLLKTFSQPPLLTKITSLSLHTGHHDPIVLNTLLASPMLCKNTKIKELSFRNSRFFDEDVIKLIF